MRSPTGGCEAIGGASGASWSRQQTACDAGAQSTADDVDPNRSSVGAQRHAVDDARPL
jgi:hypothetical protein